MWREFWYIASSRSVDLDWVHIICIITLFIISQEENLKMSRCAVVNVRSTYPFLICGWSGDQVRGKRVQNREWASEHGERYETSSRCFRRVLIELVKKKKVACKASSSKPHRTFGV